jgi:sterol desaturase/sphingolipid hydroxylase (fatty acid hydroxylase superfamily)
VIIAIPVSLVTVDYGPTVPVIALLTWLQVVFLHSPTTISFGALRVILADNRFHRIHHSLERQHFDKNFSNIFSFWDRLFGTAYFPQKGEWPAVGLAEIAQPANVREWFDLPLRYRAGSAVTESVEGSPRFQPAMLPGLGERPEPAQ